MGNLMIEISLHLREVHPDVVAHFQKRLAAYVRYVSSEKMLINIPQDSEILKTGIIPEVVTHFGMRAYLGLAYFSSAEEIVTDSSGAPIKPYAISPDYGVMKKYVKKRMRIISHINDPYEGVWIREFKFDCRFPNSPIVKTLEIFTSPFQSGINPQSLISFLNSDRASQLQQDKKQALDKEFYGIDARGVSEDVSSLVLK